METIACFSKSNGPNVWLLCVLGEPNGDDDHCVGMGPGWNDAWNDVSCVRAWGGVCKKPCEY